MPQIENDCQYRMARNSLIESFGGPVEDRIDYVKRNHATAYDRAGSHSPPKHVGSGKIPNGQQAGDDRHQDARARSPKRNLRDHARIEEASSQLFLPVVQDSLVTVIAQQPGQLTGRRVPDRTE